MDLTKSERKTLATLERRHTGIVQFLIIIIMLILGTILVLSYRQETALQIRMLALLALTACLYAMARERTLNKRYRQLVHGLMAKDRAIDRLGDQLEAEAKAREEEKARAEKLGSRLDELTRLYRSIRTVNAVTDHRQVYEQVVTSALELVSADTGSLMLYNPDLKQLRIKSARGLGDDVVAETRIAVGDGVAGWVLEHGEPLLIDGEAKRDRRFKKVTKRRTPVKSSLVVPLFSRGEAVGVLNIGLSESNPKSAITESDKSIVHIYAQNAAVSVDNAALREELERSSGHADAAGGA